MAYGNIVKSLMKDAHFQNDSSERIRIDCVSVASHDLIRLLDKPGVSAYSAYKKISFFEQGWEARFQEAHFFRGVGVP